jgi:phytoene dehydrogenase-like protein
MTKAMEDQIERFAPGFRDVIIARHTTNPAELERYNRNYLGGDIAGGANDGLQLFLRPRLALDPYFVDERQGRRIYLCSASTPPGGGVHGMCGFHAARVALRHLDRGGTVTEP